MLSRDACEALDRDDPLAFVRERFALPDGVLYLDGNSLGALPRAVPERLRAVIERQWGEDLIGSWNSHGWIDLPVTVGEKIARLVGAAPGQVICADSTSVNLFKLAAAAVRLRPGRRVILAEADDFPTDAYVLQGLADLLGLELRLAGPETLLAGLDGDVALLVLTHVHYRSGRIHDMAALDARAHAAGALTLWDLSHSAGLLDVQLDRDAADFAVGCGYKYLNGGPGAPAFLYAAAPHQAEMRLPLTGWLGHAAPFAFEQGYRPAPGVRQGLVGTPPILSMAALDAALGAFDGVSMAQVREKAMRLTSLFLQRAAERAPELAPACAADPAVRGGQVTLRHPDGYAIVRALIDAGVVGDFRAPDILRFGFAPLYVRYVDVWDAAERLAEVLRSGVWREVRYAERLAVT